MTAKAMQHVGAVSPGLAVAVVTSAQRACKRLAELDAQFARRSEPVTMASFSHRGRDIIQTPQSNEDSERASHKGETDQ